MSEDEIVDLNLKKKKKKKRTPFDLDAALAGDNVEEEEQPENKDQDNDTEKEKADDLDLDLDDFSNLGKKKKKKKKPFELSELEEALPKEVVEEDVSEKGGVDSMDFEGDLDLTLPSRKKKKKKKLVEEDGAGDDAEELDADLVTSTWQDTDRDYTYDELLKRAFDIMREKNPDMVAGEKKRFVMKPPQVMRIGTKKTMFANFTETTKMLHRQPKHLLAFLLSELGTSGSIDGNNQLIIKGRFQQKQIEIVLKRYIKEYVTCHTCRSPDTILQKDTRLYFLQCETCGSRCSVTSIKSGFQAVTGRRAAIRARTT